MSIGHLFSRDLNSKGALTEAFVIEGESLVLLIFAWMYLNILFGASPIFHHILTIAIIALALIKWTERDISLNWKLIVPLLLSVLVPSVLNQDFKGLLAGWSYFIGIICYFILFYDKNISLNVITKIFTWVIVPGYLLSVFVVGEGPRSALHSNPSTLIPLEINTYRINIGPAGTTVHFSAEIAFLLLIASLNHIKKNHLYNSFLLISIYLLLFSGARTIYFSGICVFCVFYINRFQNKNLTLIIILSLALTVYCTGFFDEIPIKIGGVFGELSKMDEYNRDLSSGRSWLWALHFDQFLQHPFFGIGRKGIDLLFQNWNLEALPATSESFYTAQLATYGIFGISFLIMIIALIKVAIADKQIIAIIFLTHMLISTISNSTYGGITSAFIPIVLSIIASSLQGAPFIMNVTREYVDRY